MLTLFILVLVLFMIWWVGWTGLTLLLRHLRISNDLKDDLKVKLKTLFSVFYTLVFVTSMALFGVFITLSVWLGGFFTW